MKIAAAALALASLSLLGAAPPPQLAAPAAGWGGVRHRD